ncbi:hypothetical protein [Oscillatoria salina]|uniref:hypothetical protein n=1 Tax=Oscillatoria salina TaxID=331517 RepID=UPI0013BE5B51|nr:hypothetical protein [Oscillatoria salina]MBZ8181889.1 hypothetical protein [Oscillatoria salina IIICB1]NET89212.1 hypothetical protein [Kamptonema sp. SIO1D9]
MPSSTSSFSFPLKIKWGQRIIRPLAICLFFITLYQVLIWGGLIPPSSGINQQQENIIKAENYVYDRQLNPELVLVGSSMAARLDAAAITQNAFNLAMAGISSQTGLEIVAEKPQKPDLVLVEINDTIERGANQDLLSSLYNPFLYSLRLLLPMFRQEYQPVSVFVDWLRGENNPQGTTKEQVNPEIRAQLVENYQTEWNHGLPEDLEQRIRIEAEEIKNTVSQLKELGVEVILFEMPIEETLANTVRQKQVQKLVRDLFPNNNYRWLQPPPEKDWITTDGIHLVVSEAQKYADFLKQQLPEVSI